MKRLLLMMTLLAVTVVNGQVGGQTEPPADFPVESPAPANSAAVAAPEAPVESSPTIRPIEGGTIDLSTDSAHKACGPNCTKPCCADKAEKKGCGPDCTKPCCAEKKADHDCGPGCTRPCCADQPAGKCCGAGCAKPCCAEKTAAPAACCSKGPASGQQCHSGAGDGAHKGCGKGKRCSPKMKPGMGGLVFDLGQAGDALGIRAIDDINGNSSVLWKYMANPSTVYRLGFGVKGINYKRSQVDSVGQARVTIDSAFKQVDLYLAPGYEFHFKGNKRLDPYVGGMVEWGFLGKSKSDRNTLSQDTTGTVTQTFSREVTRGASLGINAFAGFNYFVGKQLAIGAEYTLGYNHAFGGGDWSEVTIDVPLSGVNVVQRNEGSDVTKSGTFSMNSFVGLTLSYYFWPVPAGAGDCTK